MEEIFFWLKIQVVFDKEIFTCYNAQVLLKGEFNE